MTIEIDDREARLLYAVVLEKAQEHFRYANTSDLTERLFKLATNIRARISRQAPGER
jgi:hypothetical protein